MDNYTNYRILGFYDYIGEDNTDTPEEISEG